MTIWHWVRHGPTHETTFVGWRDVPADLSDRKQISRLQNHLPDSALLVSSDLARAADTASILELTSHQRLPDEADLREIDFGVWDGMSFDSVEARDPDLSRAFWEQPGDITAPDGESWNQTARRVNAVVDRLSARYPTSEIIAVAHFGVILTQVQRALDVMPCDVLAHKIDNFSVTSISLGSADQKVHCINHLP